MSSAIERDGIYNSTNGQTRLFEISLLKSILKEVCIFTSYVCRVQEALAKDGILSIGKKIKTKKY